MKSAYHGLLVVNAPRAEVHQRICEWVDSSKFRLEIRANRNKILATYPGWRGFGITDRQTSSVLEVLLAEMDGKTAVSIYHHTRRFFIFTGAMCSSILEHEADSLAAALEERFSIA
jgi:hypothetical protein